MRQFRNSGWPFYSKVQAIVPASSCDDTGDSPFFPACSESVPAPFMIDDESLSPTNAQEPPTSYASGSGTTTLAAPTVPLEAAAAVPATNFDVPRLPFPNPPSTSTSSTGKRARDDALLDSAMEESSFTSSRNAPSSFSSESLSMSGLHNTSIGTSSHGAPAPKKPRSARIASSSSGSALMNSAARAQKITPAAAVMGMQGSINRIGDILEWAVTSNAAQAPPAPAPPPSSESNIRASTTLERAMHIMHTEDAELPSDELGMLMTIFSAAGSERAMEIYVQSPHAEARCAYIKYLITSHNVLLKKT